VRGWSSAVRSPCGAPRAPPSGASVESDLRFRTDSTTRGRRRAGRHPPHGSTVNQPAKPDLPSTRVTTRSSQSESATLQARLHSGEIVPHKGYTYKVGGGGSIWPRPLRKQVDLKAESEVAWSPKSLVPAQRSTRSVTQTLGRITTEVKTQRQSPRRDRRRRAGRRHVPSILILLSVIVGGQLLGVIFAVPALAALRILFDFLRARFQKEG
jgi:hypothetical protein